jgi:hypothetical protein
MAAMIAKLGMGILMKLVTEAFASKILVYGLNQIAKSTNNKLDDQMTKAVADALGVAVE